MLLLACTLSSTGASAQAVDDAPNDEPSSAPQRPPFGQLRTGSDGIGSDRVPVEFQPLREVGNRALSPPRSDREAWQVRVMTTVDADDNLLLAATDHRKGAALLLSPGANWLQTSPRHRVEVDASAELLQKLGGGYDGSRVDAATVQASASASVSETASLNYYATLLRSHDPAGNTAVTPLPTGVQTGEPNQRFLTDYQRHDIGARWSTGPRSDLSANWTGSWARSERPDFVRTQTQEVQLDSHWQADPLLRVGLLLRGRSADFQALPGARYPAVQFESEALWSPRLLARAAIGAGWPSGGSPLALWRVGLTQTFLRGQSDLTLERDLTAPPGLGGLYEMRGARIEAAWRIWQRARIEASLSVAEYRPLGAAGIGNGNGTVRTVRPRVSFSLPWGARTWFNLRYQRSDDQALQTGLKRQGNKVLASILRAF